jgi:outer membrane scaffolding protein for murein synthesis (MipA/OmpV family)
MHHFKRMSLAAVLLMVLAGAGWTLAQTGFGAPRPARLTDIISASASTSADIDARRAEMDRRISDARQAGKLKGVGYMALLNEQQKLLVEQRRVEAQGYQPAAVQQLMADLDRASANIDWHLADR